MKLWIFRVTTVWPIWTSIVGPVPACRFSLRCAIQASRHESARRGIEEQILPSSQHSSTLGARSESLTKNEANEILWWFSAAITTFCGWLNIECRYPRGDCGMGTPCGKTPAYRSVNAHLVARIVAALRHEVLVVLLVFCGCAGPRHAEQSQVVTEGPWEVKQRDVAPYGFQFDIGPFRTSPIGVLHGKELRNIPKPETETVHFLKDNAGMTFELTHANGQTALVRSGLADTGQVVQIGFIKAAKRNTTAGSVSIDGRVIGQFSVRRRETPLWGKSADEDPAGVEAGTVTTSAGTITVIQRFQAPPPAESVVAAIFQHGDEPVEEFRLGDRIVASCRSGVKHGMKHTVTMEPDLPIDVQFCIAAAMTVPLRQMAANEAAANQNAMSNSMMRLAR